MHKKQQQQQQHQYDYHIENIHSYATNTSLLSSSTTSDFFSFSKFPPTIAMNNSKPKY